MTLLSNIKMNEDLQSKISANALKIPDHLLLALANYTASIFPTAKTYIGSQQQSIDAPAVFVDYYDIKSCRQLADTSKYTFGIKITYVPKTAISTSELNSAIFLILQSLEKLNSDIGTFICYEKDSDITDNLVHVTATVQVWEVAVPNDTDGLVIMKADPMITKIEKRLLT